MPVSALIAAAVLAAPVADAPQSAQGRHPGVYEFVPAPQAVCEQRVKDARRAPDGPQLLGELPAAYAIRLTQEKTAPQEERAYFTLQRIK